MQIYDISMTISPEMAVWPKDDPVKIEPSSRIADGANANTSHLDMGNHVGTHIDAPLHFIDGATSIDNVDLAHLVGPAEVIECLGVPAVTADMLRGKIEKGVIPLLKTDSSAVPETAPFDENYVYLTEDAGRLLVEVGVPAVGLDYLSVAEFGNSAPLHKTLLGAGVIAIEGLRLADVPPGRYTLVCLPLKLRGCDGAPARAILIA